MLSPPPSPRPFSTPLSFSPTTEQKKSVGRRYLYFVLLLPLCLVLGSFVSPTASRVVDWHTRSLFHSSRRSLRPDNISLNRREATSTNPPVFSNPLAQPSPSSGLSTPSMSAPQSPSSGSKTGLPVVPTFASDTPGIVPTPFPEPFDVSLSSNFSTSQCQDFFLSFIQDPTFRKCRPMSLLLGTSQQLTQAQSNITLFTDIIWGTCNTASTEADCQSTMTNLTATLQTECRTELAQDNILAKQALTGFQMYTAMRDASCLIDQASGSYCLADAVASPSPDDFYFYLLPYGNTLPNGTVPSCSSCIKNVLSIYAQALSGPVGSQQSSGASSIPLDHTYPAAAQIAVQKCGAVYAQQVNTSGASVSLTSSSLCVFLASLLSFVLWFF